MPAVRNCPLHLEVIEDFSKNSTVPISWLEPSFSDNTAVTQVAKTMVTKLFCYIKVVLCVITFFFYILFRNQVGFWVLACIMCSTSLWTHRKTRLRVISLSKSKVYYDRRINKRFIYLTYMFLFRSTVGQRDWTPKDKRDI